MTLWAAVLVAVGARVPTEADRLFARGRELLRSHPAEACAAFQRSFELDPALGTLMNLGLCQESIGRTASAWLSFNRAREWAARTHEADREAFARRHIEALAPKLSWLAISIPSGVLGLEVTLDGKMAGLEGAVSLPVDPGTHAVAATAPDCEPWTATVVAPPPGLSLSVVVPKLTRRAASAGVEAPNAGSPWLAPPAPEVPREVRAPPAVGASAVRSRLPGIAATTAGGVLLAGGAVAFVWSLSVHSAAQPQRLDQVPTDPGQVTRAQFNTARNVYPASIAAMGLGVLTAGFGVWLLARPAGPVSVGLVPTPGGSLFVAQGVY